MKLVRVGCFVSSLLPNCQSRVEDQYAMFRTLRRDKYYHVKSISSDPVVHSSLGMRYIVPGTIRVPNAWLTESSSVIAIHPSKPIELGLVL